jgi:hypothetical protein
MVSGIIERFISDKAAFKHTKIEKSSAPPLFYYKI